MSNSRIAQWFLSSLLVAALVLALAHPRPYPPYVEGRDYVRMAQGEYASAYFYYAGRILHPWLAGHIAKAFAISITEAFRWLAIALTPVLILCATYPLRRLGFIPQLIAGATFFINPIVVDAIRNYYFQDLLFLALVAILLVLFSRRPAFAMPILFLLALTRETVIFILLIVVLVAVVRKQYALILLAAICCGAGMLISHELVLKALPNKHGIGVLATDLLKVPYNAAHNLMGIVVWTDTGSDINQCRPHFKVDVSTFGLGHITEIGVCDWDPALPLSTLELLLTSFGLLPAMLLYHRRAIREHLNRASGAWLVGFGSGLAALVFAPLIGTWTARYLLYAWPLFWATAAGLLGLSTSDGAVNRSGLNLAAFGCAVAWLPIFVYSLFPESVLVKFALDGVLVAAYVAFLWFGRSQRLLANRHSGPALNAFEDGYSS